MPEVGTPLTGQQLTQPPEKQRPRHEREAHPPSFTPPLCQVTSIGEQGAVSSPSFSSPHLPVP